MNIAAFAFQAFAAHLSANSNVTCAIASSILLSSSLDNLVSAIEQSNELMKKEKEFEGLLQIQGRAGWCLLTVIVWLW